MKEINFNELINSSLQEKDTQIDKMDWPSVVKLRSNAVDIVKLCDRYERKMDDFLDNECS
jgi:hypothetical protein